MVWSVCDAQSAEAEGEYCSDIVGDKGRAMLAGFKGPILLMCGIPRRIGKMGGLKCRPLTLWRSLLLAALLSLLLFRLFFTNALWPALCAWLRRSPSSPSTGPKSPPSR